MTNPWFKPLENRKHTFCFKSRSSLIPSPREVFVIFDSFADLSFGKTDESDINASQANEEPNRSIYVFTSSCFVCDPSFH